MDYKDQDGNSEGLFGARNENSVLFSIDSLNALDSEASNNGGTGFGPSGEESGLIDINTLQRMGGASSSDEGGDVAPIAMESMVFNQVVTKHEKRKTAIIIAVFVVVLITAAITIIAIINSKNAEMEQATLEQKKEAEETARQLQAKQDEIDALEQKNKQAEADSKRRTAEIEEIEAAYKKQLEAQSANSDMPDSAAGGKKGGAKKGGGAAKPGESGDGDAPAAPAPAKSAGGKASPEAVKSALQAVTTKAQKCGKNGNLAVSFSIGGNKAKGVSATGGSFKGTATEKCILTVIEKHSWPDGTASGIKYNFKL